MRKEEKEIIYKLQSKGFEIYKDNTTEKFLISKHICNCGQDWFTNKKQCIFCGSLGYNVYICKNNHISKLASKPNMCSHRGCDVSGNDLEVGCINPKCSSNTDTAIKDLVLKITDAKSKSKGIFASKSAFSVSQAICFFCGDKTSQFVSEELDIFILDNENELINKIKSSQKIIISKIGNKFITMFNDEEYGDIKEMYDVDINKISKKLFTQLFV